MSAENESIFQKRVTKKNTQPAIRKKKTVMIEISDSDSEQDLIASEPIKPAPAPAKRASRGRKIPIAHEVELLQTSAVDLSVSTPRKRVLRSQQPANVQETSVGTSKSSEIERLETELATLRRAMESLPKVKQKRTRTYTDDEKIKMKEHMKQMRELAKKKKEGASSSTTKEPEKIVEKPAEKPVEKVPEKVPEKVVEPPKPVQPVIKPEPVKVTQPTPVQVPVQPNVTSVSNPFNDARLASFFRSPRVK